MINGGRIYTTMFIALWETKRPNIQKSGNIFWIIGSNKNIFL